MIRLYEIKLRPGQNEDCLIKAVYKKLGIKEDEHLFSKFKISGKSIDARDKKNIRIVYNVDFSLRIKTEEKFLSSVYKKNRKLKIKIIDEKEYSPDQYKTYKAPTGYLKTGRTTSSAKSDKEGNNGFYSPTIGRPDKKIVQSITESGYSADGYKSIEEPVVEFEYLPNGCRRPVVVGFGPAGIFAGLFLAINGLKPVIIERGKPVDARVEDAKKFWNDGIFNPDSNPLFGEGGAGTFSDGKLTTGKNDKRISYILREFHEAGAPDEIMYVKHPHIGTDVLRTVIKNIRKKIISLGGEIRFNTCMTEINTENSLLKSISIIDNGNHKYLNTDSLILATGHSARDTYKILSDKGIDLEQKPFSIGLRIEHDQKLIDRNQYGYDFEKIYDMTMKDAGMPPAEYKLSHRLDNGRGVYTFCMCPGGEIITTAAEEGTVSVNGMSLQARDGPNANSALLVDVRTEDYENDDPLSGIEFQRKYEQKAFIAGNSNYQAPSETVGQFMEGDSILSGCLPGFAAKGIKEAIVVFGKKIKGFDSNTAMLKGIESGSSSPVRITRDKEFSSSINGIFPCGEGAGYAGGITSSAIDGLKCAEAVLKKQIEP